MRVGLSTAPLTSRSKWHCMDAAGVHHGTNTRLMTNSRGLSPSPRRRYTAVGVTSRPRREPPHGDQESASAETPRSLRLRPRPQSGRPYYYVKASNPQGVRPSRYPLALSGDAKLLLIGGPDSGGGTAHPTKSAPKAAPDPARVLLLLNHIDAQARRH